MTAIAMLQSADAKPAPYPVPSSLADFAYEYKLGQASAEDPHATCPIHHSAMYAEVRRKAWFEGRRTRRLQLGLKNRALQPLHVGRYAPR